MKHPQAMKAGNAWRAFALMVIATAIGIAASPCRAVAALGENASSVTSDASKMGAETTSISASGYSVERFVTTSEITVNEYVSPADKVFAITWRGPGPPDLKLLLGRYFAQFRAARALAPSMGLHEMHVEARQVVVDESGQMHMFWCRAYLPADLPPGTDLLKIQ